MIVGILGGTFDPPHFGHLDVATIALEEGGVREVWLVPCLEHRFDKRPAPFHDRLAMTRMATDDSPLLEVLDLEGQRQGFSYSIETLKEIHKLFQTDLDLFFIIGLDAFQEIKTWKEYRRLFDYTHFVVINRPGFPSEELEPFILSLDVGFQREGDDNIFVNASGNLLIYREATLLEVSSTRIRDMVADGRSIRFLVPESVRGYITEKGLYRFNGDY